MSITLFFSEKLLSCSATAFSNIFDTNADFIVACNCLEEMDPNLISLILAQNNLKKG